MAQAIEGFQRHVATRHSPLVVPLQQERADEAHDSGLVGEDGDDVGAPLDLAVEGLVE
jgi:hypothetical protein